MDETRVTVQGADWFDLDALVEATKGCTPGKWEYDGYRSVVAGSATVVGYVEHCFEDLGDFHVRSRRKANAHLIAAAPALLAHAQAQAGRIAELEAEKASSDATHAGVVNGYRDRIVDLKAECARLRTANGRLLEACKAYHDVLFIEHGLRIDAEDAIADTEREGT